PRGPPIRMPAPLSQLVVSETGAAVVRETGKPARTAGTTNGPLHQGRGWLGHQVVHFGYCLRPNAPPHRAAASPPTLTPPRRKIRAAQSGIDTRNCPSSSITNSAASRLSRMNRSPHSSGNRSAAWTAPGVTPARRATSRRTDRANAAAKGASGIRHSATNSASACAGRTLVSGLATQRPPPSTPKESLQAAGGGSLEVGTPSRPHPPRKHCPRGDVTRGAR